MLSLNLFHTSTLARSNNLVQANNRIFNQPLFNIFIVSCLMLMCSFNVIAAKNKPQWIATFSAPPQKNGLFRPPFEAANLNNQTVRNIVHISLGGHKVRVRLSNAFGSQPLIVDKASVSLYQSSQFHQPVALSFNGQVSTLIPVGSDIYSDPVSLTVANDSDLAVSVYIAGDSGAPTIEDVTNKTSFIVDGDQTQQTNLPSSYQSIDYGYFMRGVEVMANIKASVVATFGSSILDGFGSGIDDNNSFTNYLSRRFHSKNKYKNLSTISASISGNRLLDESSVFGRAGLARIDDDVLA